MLLTLVSSVLALGLFFFIKYIIRLWRNPDRWYEEHREWDD